MIYLDHAATSFPKPAPVLAAVQRWFAEVGVSAERGDSERCAVAADVVAETRARLASLCGVPAARIAFTSGATEGLNLMLRALVHPGARVVTTALEHSSLARPLVALREPLGLELTVVPADRDGRVEPEAILAAADHARADVLAFCHAGNVTGAVLPAAELCAWARPRGCTTIVDASQTAGRLPLAVGADALVASAHKGLLAPPGLGFVAAHPDLELPAPPKPGGSGSARALDRHPTQWPTVLEAGTPNTPAIFGLHAALAWLAERGPDIAQHELQLIDQLRAALEQRPGTRVLGPRGGERIGVLSFACDDLDPAEAGILLAEAGVHVRTGFHCAPWLHRYLQTEGSGTVRVSPGPDSSEADVLTVARALAR